MSLTRLIAGLCLALLLCTPLGAQENAAPAPKPKAEKVLASGGKAQPGAKAESKDTAKDAAKDALDALPEWEKRYVKETRITIENNIQSLMDGILSRKDVATTVDTFCRTWDKWAESKLFILDDDRDIDVYGNLYSLQVMCRTLFLAAGDWNRAEPSEESGDVLEKAQWLEQRSRRLAEPVAEIIRNQSYSSYLPRRIEIMQGMLPYVDICWKERGYFSRLK